MHVIYINRLKIKSIEPTEMTWTCFVINKGTWIDYMKGLQVSGTLSDE